MLKSLLSRSGILAAAVAGAIALSAPAAEAKTHVHIWIGLPGITYWYGPGRYRGYYRHWLTCGEGRRIVDHSGFNAVSAYDCSPRFYHYRARRNGHWFTVRLDALTGHISAWRR